MTDLRSSRIAFVGSGVMAEVMISGLLSQGAVEPEWIWASGPREDRAIQLREAYGIHGTTDNIEVVGNADLVVLSVKPQTLPKVLPEIRKGIRHVIYLEHGKPLVFGKAKDKGIRMSGTHMEVIQLGNGLTADDCLVWDENLENPATAFLAAQLLPPRFPTAVGVFRAVDMPSYEERVLDQMHAETNRLGVGKLDDLLRAGDAWIVPEGQTVS